MIRSHNRCNGYIDARPCSYDATQIVGGGLPVCRIHVGAVHIFRKRRPPPYSWAEPGKAIDPFRCPILNMYGSCQMCSKASKVVFFGCGEHRCCSECAGTIDSESLKSCPICLSLQEH